MIKTKRMFRYIGLAIAGMCLALCLSSCGPKMITVQIDDPLSGTSEVEIEDGKTVSDALEAADVSLGADDTVSPAADTKLKAGDIIDITRAMHVTVIDGENTYDVVMNEGSVADALAKAQVVLEEGDTTDIALDALAEDGMVITVVRPVPEPEPDPTPASTYENATPQQTAPTGVYEVSRTPVPNCDDGSHGYYEIQMSDGTMRYEEY